MNPNGTDNAGVIVADAPTLRQYLKLEVEIAARCRGAYTDAYVSTADLVLREGYAYAPEAAMYDSKHWGYRGEDRQCFKNALRLALAWPDELAYVEGYALAAIPVLHAWTVRVSTGAVVDPTWGAQASCDREYLGIPFRAAAADRITDERGTYGVIDDWQHDWPLLRRRLDRSLIDERVAPARVS